MGKLIIILQANSIRFHTGRSQIAETVKKYITVMSPNVMNGPQGVIG